MYDAPDILSYMNSLICYLEVDWYSCYESWIFDNTCASV